MLEQFEMETLLSDEDEPSMFVVRKVTDKYKVFWKIVAYGGIFAFSIAVLCAFLFYIGAWNSQEDDLYMEYLKQSDDSLNYSDTTLQLYSTQNPSSNILFLPYVNKNSSFPIWTWTCSNNFCERSLAKSNEIAISLETCSMCCGKSPLWPYPKRLEQKNCNIATYGDIVYTIIDEANFPEASHFLYEVFDIFLNNVPYNKLKNVSTNVMIYLSVDTDDIYLGTNTDESYKILIKKSNEGNIIVNVTGTNSFGVRHGLETLSQLMWRDDISNETLILYDVYVEDKPSFPHRGFHLDTARNFFSIDSIKKIIDGMAANKLNVLHLHLTDSTSFPIELPHNKEFAMYGAYGKDKIYSVEDIENLIMYAKYRGIRTVLEIDAPSHANEGWNVDENLIICGDDNVFNGHLNPDYNMTFEILESVYSDLFELGTSLDTFHIGGDEVNLSCWRQTMTYSQFHDEHKLWCNFTNEMIERVKRANKGSLPEQILLWSSPLTDRHLNSLNHKENIVVQFWYGQIEPILNANVRVLYSTVGHWYLDCGSGPWLPTKDRDSCAPYTPWTQVYEYRPWALKSAPSHISQVIGGEICLWTEEVSESDLPQKVWPRTTAFAERVWSDPVRNPWRVETAARLQLKSDRMEARGVKGIAVWPRWCALNPGKCL